MKEYIINQNDCEQRLDKFLSKAIKTLPCSKMYKAIRKKQIKVNGKRTYFDYILKKDDCIQLYLNDDFFNAERPSNFTKITVDLDVLYEDDNIILLNKPAGLLSMPDEKESYNTLANHLKAYLWRNGDYNPENENSFAPALCNRIDRNTSGIVIGAKNAPALKEMNDIIKNRNIEKFYTCIAIGILPQKNGEISGYIYKDNEKNLVSFSKKQVPKSKTAVTKYRVIDEREDLSLIEAQLITGRTHQIRAGFAAIGHPLLGDTKYGDYKKNKQYNKKFQALCSCKIIFDFNEKAYKSLEYLNKKSFYLDCDWDTFI